MRRPVAILLAASIGIACSGAPPEASAPLTTGRFAREGAEGPSPLSLTASDGRGLALASLDAKAVVEGPLAFVELRLAYRNPEPRGREGTFSMRLPEGASVSRFAMAMGGAWREGEVVPKRAARATYEAFLHQRVDPALLEAEGGGRFEARVFPIEPLGEVEIVVSYTEPREREGEPLRIPLGGLPSLGRLSVRVTAQTRTGKTRRFELERQGVAPSGDLLVDVGEGPEGLASGEAVLARVPVPIETRPDPVEDLAVLVDTSASSGPWLGASLGRLERVLSEVGERAPGARVAVVAFDQEARTVWQGHASAFSAKALDGIRARGALGATDLGLALSHLAGFDRVPKRALLVSDGEATLGPLEAGELEGVLSRLRRRGARRLDAMAPREVEAAGLLAALAGKGLGRRGVVLGGRGGRGAPSESEALFRAARGGAKIRVPGSLWYLPREVPPGFAGDTLLVYARLPGAMPLEVEVEAGGEVTTARVPLAPGTPLLVERAVAGARMGELLGRLRALPAGETGSARRASLEREVVALSVEHRVLSPLTSMLVLETEEDYAAFGLDRRALGGIMTVGERGIEVLERAPFVPRPPPPRTGWERLLPAPEPSPRGRPPPSDWDGDGIPIPLDACPGEAGVPSAVPRRNGCPEPIRRILAMDEVVILDQIQFPKGSSRIPAEGRPILDRVARLLEAVPELRLVEIAGHTDGGGSEATNLRISQARADAVRGALAARGIDPARLVAKGYGASHPIDDNRTKEGAARNRRVGFRVLRQDPLPPPPPPPPLPLPRGRPHEGPTEAVMEALGEGEHARALSLARALYAAPRRDVLALLALGEALEASGDLGGAARAYGSLIDLAPGRAELRRHAGQRFERLALRGHPAASRLAVDTYRRALALRPEHPSSHRLLAFSLAQAGLLEVAFEVLRGALLGERFSFSRFPEVEGLLRDDLAVIGAALLRGRPASRPRVLEALGALGLRPETEPSLRVALSWETDASNLDLFVVDRHGLVLAPARPGALPPGATSVAAGGGYGPEALVLRGEALRLPVTIHASLGASGPQGHALGAAHALEHDGLGGLRFHAFPFVLMNQGGVLELGRIPSPNPSARP